MFTSLGDGVRINEFKGIERLSYLLIQQQKKKKKKKNQYPHLNKIFLTEILRGIMIKVKCIINRGVKNRIRKLRTHWKR